MALIILRCVFTLAVSGLAVSIIKSSTALSSRVRVAAVGSLRRLVGGRRCGDCDRRLPTPKTLDVISSVYFGLIVGMFMAYIAQLVIPSPWCP